MPLDIKSDSIETKNNIKNRNYKIMVIEEISSVGKNISTVIMALQSCVKITNKYYQMCELQLELIF
jgi:hypothetical protein